MKYNANNIVVVYKSKYGTGKQYAEWIADEVNADLFERSKVSIDDLLQYDTIVYGGSMYAVGILGISLIKKNFDKIKDKKIIIFSVGASPPHPEAIEAVKNSNFTDEMKESVHFFHFRGSFDYNKLNFKHKVMMYLLKKKLERKKENVRTDDEKGMLGSYDKPADWTNKKNIKPIIECILESRAN